MEILSQGEKEGAEMGHITKPFGSATTNLNSYSASYQLNFIITYNQLTVTLNLKVRTKHLVSFKLLNIF